jgi:hypothetical protein
MRKMKIRKSTEADFKRIMEIYGYARSFMAEHGNPNHTVMQNLVAKLGFVQCGIIYVEEDNYPRLAYEKYYNHRRSET